MHFSRSVSPSNSLYAAASVSCSGGCGPSLTARAETPPPMHALHAPDPDTKEIQNASINSLVEDDDFLNHYKAHDFSSACGASLAGMSPPPHQPPPPYSMSSYGYSSYYSYPTSYDSSPYQGSMHGVLGVNTATE
ncbi:hypothetical protein CAPTEDRAFT_186690 [Capitella teleta]|uniref:Uncharacterized protein n=1 Tax=Capitella teleta TaxID=283909 RepID=R7TQW6_CAPTE|nr:hypothetical protein CAPTEDRAFT_186690 [Capitella teleta]|eukprot:ELT95967.1 hypothetical protein CAPTEDRAFT_186690 [Capitella teleta]